MNAAVLFDRLVGQVVKASASRVEDPGFESRLHRDFFLRSSHTSDLKIGTPVATLPGAGSVLELVGPMLVYCDWESLICNFCLSVAARKIV